MPIRSAKLRQTTDARHCFHSVRGVVVACLAGWLITQPAAWAAPEPVSTKASAPVVAASAPVAPEEESSWWSRPKRLLSDVRSNATVAAPLAADGEYALTGHKWFFSAPMCDGFLVLAQAPGGLRQTHERP